MRSPRLIFAKDGMFICKEEIVNSPGLDDYIQQSWGMRIIQSIGFVSHLTRPLE